MEVDITGASVAGVDELKSSRYGWWCIVGGLVLTGVFAGDFAGVDEGDSLAVRLIRDASRGRW